jgi:chemotaxis protein histidine kinase CheA
VKSEKNKKIMEDLKKEYLQNLPLKWAAINAASLIADKSILRDEYHKIKGSGKTYGYPEVSLLGAAMESICDLYLKNTVNLKKTEDLEVWVKRSLELLTKTIENRQHNSEFLIESDKDYQLMIQFIKEKQ